MSNKRRVGSEYEKRAAEYLKEQGYDVTGVTMQIWHKEDACTIEHEGGCCGLSAVEDARRVA